MKISACGLYTRNVLTVSRLSPFFSRCSRTVGTTRRRYCFVELDCYVSMALQRHGIEKRVKRSLPQLRDFFSVLDDSRPVPVCGQSDYTDGLCRFFSLRLHCDLRTRGVTRVYSDARVLRARFTLLGSSILLDGNKRHRVEQVDRHRCP